MTSDIFLTLTSNGHALWTHHFQEGIKPTSLQGKLCYFFSTEKML